MGKARILSGGTAGRYTVQIDYGEAERVAQLAAANALVVVMDTNIAEIEVKITAADANTAAARAVTVDAVTILVAELQLNPTSDATKAAEDAYRRALSAQRDSEVQAAPLRVVHSALKTQRAIAAKKATALDELLTLVERDVWCTVHREDMAGFDVDRATIDIPGDSGLVLLAPRGLQTYGFPGNVWEEGDGTVSLVRKTNELTDLNTKKSDAEANLVTVNASLTSNPTNATLLMTKASLTSRISYITQQIAIWTAKPASVDPDYGDGVLYARELLTPAQCFFNAAILPGWQRDLPTYRWGTITAMNYTVQQVDIRADVELGEALTTGQRLNANFVSTLSGVPISYGYMDGSSFSVGDRVVIDLRDGWANPVIIGYLDNPKPECTGGFESLAPDSLGVGSNIRYGRFTDLTNGINALPAGGQGAYPGQSEMPIDWELVSGQLPPGITSYRPSASRIAFRGTSTATGIYTVTYIGKDPYYAPGNRRYANARVTLYVGKNYRRMEGYTAIAEHTYNVIALEPLRVYGLITSSGFYAEAKSINESAVVSYQTYSSSCIPEFDGGPTDFLPYDVTRCRVLYGPGWDNLFSGEGLMVETMSDWSTGAGVEASMPTDWDDGDELTATARTKYVYAIFELGGLEDDGTTVTNIQTVVLIGIMTHLY